MKYEKPTDKQLSRIQRLIRHKGRDFVERYFNHHFPNSNFSRMSRKQAQKIITGLSSFEKVRPIYGVHLRY